MTYYNKHTAKKIWLDNQPPRSLDRTKKRYVQAPRPGRLFDTTVPCRLILRHVNLKKSDLQTRNFRVNQNVVTDQRYPVSYKDYVSYGSAYYDVEVEKIGQSELINLQPNTDAQLVFPVKKWFLSKGFVNVLTFQNVIYRFESSRSVFDVLKSPYSCVVLDKSEDHSKTTYKLADLNDEVRNRIYGLSKLTGKDKFRKYYVNDLSISNLTYVLNLQNVKTHGVKTVKISRADFKRRYVLVRLRNVELV